MHKTLFHVLNCYPVFNNIVTYFCFLWTDLGCNDMSQPAGVSFFTSTKGYATEIKAKMNYKPKERKQIQLRSVVCDHCIR